MKLRYKLFFVALIFGVFLSNINAQSELIVEWNDANGDVQINALYDAIIADSLRPDDRVYVLRAGGYYQNTERIDNNGWHLRIIGELPDPTDEFKSPALLQMAAREDASATDGMIRGQGDITLKNLWLTGAFTGTGDQTVYQPFQIDQWGGTFVIDNVIFDRSNFAMIAFVGGDNDITITNCTFRNLIGRPSSQQWEGRGIGIWSDQKSVVIENNTFFNIGMTAIQIENGAPEYLRVVHNTFVNVGRMITLSPWAREAYFANNMIVNGYWHAEGYNDYTSGGRDPRASTSGMFGVTSLPTMYGVEDSRRVLLANTAFYKAPEFITYYGDSLRVPTLLDIVAKEDFFDVYPNIVVVDTIMTDPGMATYTTEIYADMIQNIEDLRAGVSPANEYFWNLPVFDGVECFECVTWPLPEDFSYTNNTLQTYSTNGLPLGDLNWFPEAYKTWEANHDEYVEYIESLAGPVTVFDVVGEDQAENATLSGGAAVLPAEGFSYYDMDAGFIEWTFEVPTAGQYDMDLYLHLNNRGTSGVNLFVNGFEVHDPRGWGQYVFGNDDANTTVNAGFDIGNWGWWLVKQEELKEVIDDASLTPLYLEAGTNVVQIKASWCDNLFGGLKLKNAGTETVVVDLAGGDVTAYSVASPVLEGAPWAPQWFKSVALNGGAATLNFADIEAGTYVLNLAYQNYDGASSGDILVDGASVATYNYDVDADSLGLSGLSDVFSLSAGTHAIGVSGNNVSLDVVQLVKKTVLSAENQNIPEGYALEQNYPNPFNPSTTINFKIAHASDVKLVVYNILGQKVATLLNSYLTAGTHAFQFNANNLSTGVYFYSIEAGDFRSHKKMILLK